jgi:putative GTP pyrophosphokinase
MPRTSRSAVERFLRKLDERRSDHEHYVDRLIALLTELLRADNIDFVSVSGRVKSLESAREKVKRKRYKDPDEALTDICGLRIVAYLESDIEKIVKTLQREFAVDDENSIDKRKELQTNELGYLSVHLLCSLSTARADLAEYSRFKGFKFEAQIRTVLQHAWAQIEWGRNYKFGGLLPVHLQRRLMLASGALEILDREFASIAADVDEYSRKQRAQPDEPINSVVIRSVAQDVVSKTTLAWQAYTPHAQHTVDARTEVISELKSFGINTRSELQRLMVPDLILALEQVEANSDFVNEIGLARDAMMWQDLGRYFDVSHQGHWQSIGETTLALLLRKYSIEDVKHAIAQAQLDVEEELHEDLDLDEILETIATRKS